MTGSTAAVVGSRAAEAADLPVLASLAVDARRPLADVRGGLPLLARDFRAGDELAHLTRALGDEAHLVAVGLVDATVVGYVTVVAVPTAVGTEVAEIEELYVDPEARGIGVGSAVLEAVVTWAEQRGCTGLDAVALPGDRVTKNFFEGHGLVARAILAHRPLDPGSPSP